MSQTTRERSAAPESKTPVAMSVIGGAALAAARRAWGEAALALDRAALQGFVLVASVFILVVYLVVDILYGFANPRIRHQR